MGEYDRNIDEFDQKMMTTTNINHENLWSYSPVNACRCGNIYCIFGHIHHVNVRCQFLGHVHRFRSYSFGHLDLVK